jgi:hypothetical protein
LFINSAHAVKLCKQGCPDADISAINIWKNAGGGIGSSTQSSDTWGLSVTTSPSGTVAGETKNCASNSWQCWCRVTAVNGNSCVGSWVYEGDYSNTYGGSGCSSCPGYCAACARGGSSGSCSRSALFASFNTVSSVTCPLKGACANADYKTVGDGESCGDGWTESIVPVLTISTTGSDSRGSYGYKCTK